MSGCLCGHGESCSVCDAAMEAYRIRNLREIRAGYQKEVTIAPDRKIDAMVAEKVFGGSVLDNGDGPFIWRNRKGHDLPHYSTDISAAWEVVERMKLPNPNNYEGMEPDEMEPPIQINGLLRMSDGKWMARFDGPVHGNEFPGYYERSCYPRDSAKFVIADSAPMAICLAALKSVGVEV